MENDAPNLELSNNGKPKNYPQDFVYPEAKNMPKHPTNAKAKIAPTLADVMGDFRNYRPRV